MLHPVTAESFTDIDGDKHYLQLPLLHSKSLGKRVCILDIDSRSLDQEGQILNDEPQKWLKFESLSAGMLGHYLYGMAPKYVLVMGVSELMHLDRQRRFTDTTTGTSALRRTPSEIPDMGHGSKLL